MAVPNADGFNPRPEGTGPGEPTPQPRPRDPGAPAAQPVRGEVAIIGMACLFPGATNVDAYWRNILAKVNAISDPPPDAWDVATCYDPMSSGTDKVYSKRGRYLAELAYFDPLGNAVPPRAVGGEPDQWLSLQLARDALADAGYSELPPEVRKRTAVVLGKGTYFNAGSATMAQRGMMVGQTLQILRTLHPELSTAQLAAVREELERTLPPINSETVPGLVPNIIVGRIANKLDLMGPSYTIDAACASSLIAVQIGMRDLLNGDADLALVGGSQVSTFVPTLNVFCQLGALSRREELRPFDENADGTLLGEGIGMVVLKRLADAERDGDRTCAVVKGVGTASDGRGVSVMAPRIEGEMLALERAYAAAGVSPRSVGLIEAHGTGTPVGDVVEVKALTGIVGPRGDSLPWCALGSVKSMISHTMPAAGVAGLIKIALALHHKVLPPTLNCARPNPKIAIETTPFYINTETRPWIHGGREPRRAGVNAFGFGGINAHAVLEEYIPSQRTADGAIYPVLSRPVAVEQLAVRSAPEHLPPWDSEVCILEGASRADLIERVRRLAGFLESVCDETPAAAPTRTPAVTLADVAWTLSLDLQRAGEVAPDGAQRLAVVATSLADLRAKLTKAEKRLVDPTCRQIKDVAGIYYTAQPLGRDGKLAVIFPGEGAQYPNMLADLCLHFPEVRDAFDREDRALAHHPRGYVPSDYIYPRPAFSEEDRTWAAEHIWKMTGALETVLTANWALYRLLSRLGLRPDAVIGHSSGDYSAVRAARIAPIDDDAQLSRFVLSLLEGNEAAATSDAVRRAGLLAVGADRTRVEAIAREAGGTLFVAMDNCPHQAVLVGEPEAIARAVDVVQREGLIYEELSFDRAYHTPLFEPYLDHLQRTLAVMGIRPGEVTAYSCATAAPYPADPAAIQELIIRQWVRPVEFRRTIEAMYADGARIFVESGPRGNLTAFVEDILQGKPFLAVPANVQRRSGITQLNRLVAMLTVHGVDLDLAYLFARRAPRRVELDEPARQASSSDPQIKLVTGFPVSRLSPEFARELREQLATGQPAAIAGRTGNGVRSPGAGAIAAAELAVPTLASDPLPHIVALDTIGVEPVGRVDPADGGASGELPVTPDPDGAAPDGSWELAPAAQWSADPPTDGTFSDGTFSMEPVAEAPTVPSLAVGFPRVGPVDPAERSATVRSYFETMDQFLEIQQQVMLAYFDSGSDVGQIDAPPAPGAGGNGHDSSGRDSPVGYLPGGCLPGAAGQAAWPDPASREARTLPLLGDVVWTIPGRELQIDRVFDPAEDVYLQDHTFGRSISTTDPDLLALAVMPLTMSLEILAEAATLLVPAQKVVGLRDVRANRWLACDGAPQTLRITARLVPEEPGTVAVPLRNLTEDAHTEDPPRSPVVEAKVAFADRFPARPSALVPDLIGARPSSWRPDQLYLDTRFHGPLWQGVTSIDLTAENGTIATLPVLPWSGYFASRPDASFVLDPVVLDAAGQAIGFWTLEHLATGKLIFPFHVDSLDLYEDQRPVGEATRCIATIRLMGEKQVRSDIDVVDGNGRLWMRLIGWEDKRFDLPPPLSPLLLRMGSGEASTAWPGAVAGLPGLERVECRRLSPNFTSDRVFWKLVWAGCILTRAEREQFRRMRTTEEHQLLWLAGRMAAKEAVQRLLHERYGRSRTLADIEVGPDEQGSPLVAGPWSHGLARLPLIAIAYADDVALALAAFPVEDAEGRRSAVPILGLAVRPMLVRDAPTGCPAGSTAAQPIVNIPDRADRLEWTVRCACAIEAAVRALGYGLFEGPEGVVVADVDLATGQVAVRATDHLAKLHPALADRELIVHTHREGELIVATTVCQARRPELWT